MNQQFKSTPWYVSKLKPLFWWVLITTTFWTISFLNPLETTTTTIPFILGGFIIGFGQWLIVLRKFGISRSWIVASGLGWLVVPVVALPFFYLSFYDNFSPGPEDYLLTLLGLVLGVSINAWGQWLVIRRKFARSANWIPVTALGWVIGLSLGFISPVPWGTGYFPSASTSEPFGTIISFSMMNVGTVSGLIVSVLTGILIVRYEILNDIPTTVQSSKSTSNDGLAKFIREVDNMELNKTAEEYYKDGSDFMAKNQFDDAILEFTKVIRITTNLEKLNLLARTELKSMGFSEEDIKQVRLS